VVGALHHGHAVGARRGPKQRRLIRLRIAAGAELGFEAGQTQNQFRREQQRHADQNRAEQAPDAPQVVSGGLCLLFGHWRATAAYARVR
jgi:hypothetical protein